MRTKSALLALCLLCSRAAADVQFTVTDLGTFGGDFTAAYGINNRGQVVGASTPGNDRLNTHAFFYDNGVMRDLGTMTGDRSSTAYAINDAGVIVGGSDRGYPYIDSDMGVPFIYSAGTMRLLPGFSRFPGAHQSVRGINNAGQMDGTSFGEYEATLYSSGWVYASSGGGSSAPQVIGTHAFAVNAAGHVAGARKRTPSDYYTHAMWYDGTYHDLPATAGTSSIARGINDADVVVGESRSTSTSVLKAFLWDGTLHDLGALPSRSDSQALAVGNSGWVVGTAGTGDLFNIFGNPTNYGNSNPHVAFLYRDGQMLDLNHLVPLPSQMSLTAATGINDSGQIIGFGLIGPGVTHAFLLTPVPEPGTALLLINIGGFLLVRPKCVVRRIAGRSEAGAK